VIPNFSLAGSILSRNHGLATFLHERLEWSLVDQSPEQSETEWLCVDIAGYKIINVYKPPRSQLTPTTIPTFPHPNQYVGDSIASTSTAEYCAPVWCRSVHARLIGPTINDALRIVTGCLHPTPADNLPILAGIQPAELSRRGATLSLGRCAMEPGTPAPLSAHPTMGCSCTAPQNETPICTRRTTTHQFF